MKKRELREFTRVRIEAQASGEEQTGRSIRGVIADISAKGLYLSCKQPPEEGITCEITIKLVNERKSAPIHLLCRVVRKEEAGAAFEYRSVSVDDFEKLKKLILFNADNPERVEQEYSSHLE